MRLDKRPAKDSILTHTHEIVVEVRFKCYFNLLKLKIKVFRDIYHHCVGCKTKEKLNAQRNFFLVFERWLKLIGF